MQELRSEHGQEYEVTFENMILKEENIYDSLLQETWFYEWLAMSTNLSDFRT